MHPRRHARTAVACTRNVERAKRRADHGEVASCFWNLVEHGKALDPTRRGVKILRSVYEEAYEKACANGSRMGIDRQCSTDHLLSTSCQTHPGLDRRDLPRPIQPRRGRFPALTFAAEFRTCPGGGADVGDGAVPVVHTKPNLAAPKVCARPVRTSTFESATSSRASRAVSKTRRRQAASCSPNRWPRCDRRRR